MKVTIRNAHSGWESKPVSPQVAVDAIDLQYQEILDRTGPGGWDLEWKVVANDHQPAL